MDTQTPTNQPSEVSTPTVSANEFQPGGPKKSSNLLLVFVALGLLLLVAAGSYYFIYLNQIPQVSDTDDTTEMIVASSPTLDPTEPPSVSASDDVETIEQELDDTTISDDSSLYTDIDTELQGL